jgi:hypothetical protein
VPDGWVVGVWLALGVGVPASAGESADRMPGIDGCVSEPTEPDGCAAGVWLGAADWPWLTVGESNR